MVHRDDIVCVAIHSELKHSLPEEGEKAWKTLEVDLYNKSRKVENWNLQESQGPLPR